MFAEPFAAAIRDAALGSIMSSYSCVDGLPGSGSAELLTRLLRDELGFDGMVVADYFSVTLLMSYHRVAADRSEAAIKALTAGLDLELPALNCFGAPLKAAIDEGRVPMSAVDTAVRRVLTAKMRLGLFESPYVDSTRVKPVFADPANAQLARRAATRGIVLVTNDGVLPLAVNVSKVAVIGPAADDRRLLQGDYHYPAHQELVICAPLEAADGNARSPADGQSGADAAVQPGPGAPANGNAVDRVPDVFFLPSGEGALKPGAYYTEHVTPLAGLRAALGGRAEVTYEKGCELMGDDRAGFPARSLAAAGADVAVVVVGGRSGLHEELNRRRSPRCDRLAVDGRPGGAGDGRGGHGHPHGAGRHEREGPRADRGGQPGPGPVGRRAAWGAGRQRLGRRAPG